MRPLVKICGLMRAQDARMCQQEGADLLGFVVEYPHPAPWNLSVEEARGCMEGAASLADCCVVTSGAPDKVLRIMRDTGAGYLQLHGEETPEETAYLVHELGKRGVNVIKAIFPGRPGLLEEARAFCEAGVWALLFDPRTPNNAAEGGMADLATFNELQQAVTCPVILAGSITPNNAAELLTRTHTPMIDVMSGVESAPGVKNQAKVRALIQGFRRQL